MLIELEGKLEINKLLKKLFPTINIVRANFFGEALFKSTSTFRVVL